MAHPGGRPTKLTEELISKAEQYLSSCEDTQEVLGEQRPVVVQHVKLPTIEGLALYLDINRDTVYDWEKIPPIDSDLTGAAIGVARMHRDLHLKFSDITSRVRLAQADRLVNNGLGGSYNPMIAKLLLSSKHGYVEKSEQNIKADVSTEGDKELAQQFSEFLKKQK